MEEETIDPDATCQICEDNPEGFRYLESILWVSRLLQAGFQLKPDDLSLEVWEDVGLIREYQEMRRISQLIGAMFGGGKNKSSD